jgi:hypothetical protein
MATSVKINGIEVPCENFIQSNIAVVDDKLVYEVRYYFDEMHDHEVKTYVDVDKWRKIEKKLRKQLKTR